MVGKEQKCMLCLPDKRRNLFEGYIWFEQKKSWEKWFLCSNCLKQIQERKPQKFIVHKQVDWRFNE